MSVSTTFAFTDSATPRRLISATSTRNASAIAVATGCAASPSGSSRAKAFSTFSDRKIALVDAEVMPEESTAKVTMKVRKWMPKALCTYRAARAASGDLVTIATEESAETIATAKAMMIGIQPAPPTSPATLPVIEYTPVPRMSPTMNSSSSFGVIAFFSAGWSSPEASGPAGAVSGDSLMGSSQGRGRELDGGDGSCEPVPTREGRAMVQELYLPVTAL